LLADNQQITYLPDGKKVLKYSSGMALQFLPFFAIAHSLAKPLGYEADGLSPPYQFAIHIGALLMCLFGLWFLRKLLLQYFKDSTVAWVLFFLIVGTNYLNYAAIDVGMSHAWLFSLYCLLFYLTDRFYKSPSYKTAIKIGFVLGLLVLSRPTELIAIIIPLLWGVNLLSLSSIQNRIQVFVKHWRIYLVSIVTMITIGSLQIIYWKYSTGNWLVYSYGDQNFSWLHPHLFLYTIHFKNGWLIYCPMMILPYIGFLCLTKKKEIFWPIFIFSAAFLWIVSAWDIWDYGGRAMIQSYVALMFPLAALIEYVETKWPLRIVFFGFAFLFTYLNIWWVHGIHRGGSIYTSEMSKAYYLKTVGRWHINEQDGKLLDVSEDYSGKILDADTLLHYQFNQNKPNEALINHTTCLYLQSDSSVYTNFMVPKPNKQFEWIRASIDVECFKDNWDTYRMTRFGIRLTKNNQEVKQNSILLDRIFHKVKKQHLYIDMKMTELNYDSIEVYFMNPKEAKSSFALSNLNLEAFNE